MDTILSLLRAHPFFDTFTEKQLEFVLSCATNVRFSTGAFLMREGEDATTFYLVRAGRVALEVDVPGAGPIQVEQVQAGDVIGLSWLFPPHRVSIDARAIEPVRALSFNGTCLRTKMASDHDLGYAVAMELLAHLSLRLRRVRMQRLDLYRAGS